MNAILRRTGKTLLIEGVTDKTILNRVRLESNNPMQNGSIDCVEIITDPLLSRSGNKVKIKNIEAHLQGLSEPTKQKAIEKFSCFIDREWDGVNISTGIPHSWTPPLQNSGTYTTSGHSIENYLFSPESVSNQIKSLFPNHVTKEYLNLIDDRFHKIIALSTAYSISIQNYAQIKRADGLINRFHIKWNGQYYELVSKFDIDASKREIVDPAIIRQKTNSLAADYIRNYASHIPGQWICHGHLGEQMIWACIANQALELSISDNHAREIERSTKENRIRCAADQFCKLPPANREPIDSVISWLDN